MRTVLAVLCIIAGLVAGLYRSSVLKRREQLLSEITGLCESMATHIRYSALPLGELFAALPEGEFIGAVLAGCRAEGNCRAAWIKAAQRFPELDDGDRELIAAVGNRLGGSDTAGQLAMLELHKEFFSNRLKEASEAFAKKGAMYRQVGLLSGLALAVVVI